MAPTVSSTHRLRAWLEYPVSSAPTVSADGRWVFFVSRRGGLPQAWGMPLAGGPAHLLHEARENVGHLSAAPEGSALLLALDQGGNEHWQLFARDGDPQDQGRPARALTHDPTRIHEPGAWRDAHRIAFTSNRRDPRFFDAYEMDVRQGGEPRLLRQEDANVQVVAAERGRVLVSRSNTNLDQDLILLEDGRESRLTPHAGELSIPSADFLGPDVITAANPDREFSGLVRYRTNGALEVIREFDGDVELVKTEPGGSRVAYEVNREGRSELRVWDSRSGADQRVELPGTGVVDAVAWVPSSDSLVFDFSSPSYGLDVWRCDLAAGAVRALTRSSVPMPGPGVEPALHSFRAQDGLTVPYWEYAPAGGRVRGTIIAVHGGPEAQARPLFANGVYSHLVSEGWRVIQPNVRGSLGYGRTYVHLDDVRKRMDSVRDLRDLAHALAADGKGRLGEFGITGGSYGGFMVLSALTTYPDLWGAGVETVGIANFVTFLEKTGPWRRKLREAEYGSLETDREFLESISPLHQADRIVAPLLVGHGANDPRVPIGEAEQIVAALRKHHVPVEFLRFENEGHGFVRIENQVEALRRAHAFFDRYLPRPPVPAGRRARARGRSAAARTGRAARRTPGRRRSAGDRSAPARRAAGTRRSRRGRAGRTEAA